MSKTDSASITLPKSLIEELEIWKMAFGATYGNAVSYAEMILQMLGSMNVSNPAVVQELNTILKANPELKEKWDLIKQELEQGDQQ